MYYYHSQGRGKREEKRGNGDEEPLVVKAIRGVRFMVTLGLLMLTIICHDVLVITGKKDYLLGVKLRACC